MRTLLRSLVINGGALWVTTTILPGLIITGGFKGLMISTVALMVINFLLVPLIKILLLPLNLLTLGIFAWLTNVLALYFLVTIVPAIQIMPYVYEGSNYSGFIIPAMTLSTLQVTVLASLLIGLITHFLYWLIK